MNSPGGQPLVVEYDGGGNELSGFSDLLGSLKSIEQTMMVVDAQTYLSDRYPGENRSCGNVVQPGNARAPTGSPDRRIRMATAIGIQDKEWCRQMAFAGHRKSICA